MKKFIYLLFLACFLFLTGCQDSMTVDCAPVEEWSYDEDGHWHACVIPGCTDKMDVGKHEFGDWEFNAPASGTKPATKKRECIECGYVDIADIKADEHICQFGSEWSSNGASHYHECSCGKKDNEIPHTWDSGEVTQNPTEDSEGVKSFTCSICGYVKNEPIDKLEHSHSFGDEWESDDDGHWHECACSVINDYGAHTWDNGVETLAPTEESEGEMIYTCTTCNRTKTATIDKLEHVHNYSTTYSYNSSNHWFECSNGCGEHKDVAPHSFGTEVITKQPTYETPGTKTSKCITCNYEKVETIPMLVHSFSTSWSSDETNHWYACTEENCNEKKDLGQHTFGEPESVSDGQKFTCSTCNYSYTISVSKWDGSTESASLSGTGTEADPFLIKSAADMAYFRTNVADFASKYVKLMVSVDMNNTNFMIGSFAGIFDGNNNEIRGLNISSTAKNTGLFSSIAAGGVVKNLIIYGTISGGENVGGVAGSSAGNISNVKNYANVTGEYKVAGIVGDAAAAFTIDNCQNYGEIKALDVENVTTTAAGQNAAGIIGQIYKVAAKVTNCKNYGKVHSTGNHVGGIVAWTNTVGQLLSCENHGEIKSDAAIAGGIAGLVTSNITIESCTNLGAVSAATKAGGIAGTSKASFKSCTNTGNVTATGKLVGGIVASLEAAKTVNNCTNNGTIKGTTQVGGIVGEVLAKATISNCTNNGDIVHAGGTTGGASAGILGQDNGKAAIVTGCINNGNVSGDGTDNIGGILGWGKGTTLTNCENNGTITATKNANTKDSALGGVAGCLGTGTITGCKNNVSAVVSGKGVARVGGIVGYSGAAITDCTNYGTVYGQSNTGGIIGKYYGASGSEITNCTNKGAIIATSYYIGGVVGNAAVANFINCKNEGAVSSSASGVGGVAGIVNVNTTLTNCQNSGSVTGTKDVGGIVYDNKGALVNCDNSGVITATTGGTTGGIYVTNTGTVDADCEDLR